ncbi:MAG TPA: M13 family metallopeptidase [Candidatus Acidoferrum sp.]|nr:M13 family metallopeptidase [Candidatus Acidoferrum sp.]
MTRHTFCLALVLMLCTLPVASQPGHVAGSAVAAEAAAGDCSFAFADQEQNHGFDLANLDRSVSPCDNFFGFADGGWVKANPIPAAYSSWGTFNILHQHNEDVLHDILEEASKDKSAKPGSNWQKIGDFYATCMDESQIEAAGAKPLQPEFNRITAIHDAATLQVEIARLQTQGVPAVFAFGPQQDFKDSTREIATLRQGGLGLPERDYYLRDDEKSKQIRDAYVQHVTNMFKLLGDDGTAAGGEAKTVLDIETSLAKASMKRVDMRNPDNVYHLKTVAEVRDLAPHLVWDEYLKEIGSPAVSDINVAQPDFFKGMDAALSSVSLAEWKTYLRWHLIHAAAPGLSQKFVDENFDFYGRTLTGAKELLPRWRRCVEATDRQLGEALGQYYVQRAFPPAAKAKAQAMVGNLIAALRDDLKTLDWMSPETSQKAIEKLDAITPHIGYPDKWRDYSKFDVTRASFAENVIHGDEFEHARQMAKIGQPVDRTEWGMTPPTVNAYYNPTMNEIVFPAGILQPPFYDPNRDDAMNYGGIGAVIGHEMTHGFDDSGARFDPQGNLKNWWTPEDLKNFTARGDCIAKQFDSFEVEPGLHENGKLVEGESIADLGGLTIALAAYHHSIEGKPAPPAIDGFTPEQRFFLAYAQVWEGSFRPEVARLRVNTDSHPLNQFRTNAPLSNMPSFSKAWGCSATSAMVRPEGERCRIW